MANGKAPSPVPDGTASRREMEGRRGGRRLAKVERRFLAALARTGTVRAAAAAVGFTPATLYGWRRSSDSFRACWDAAKRRASARPRAATATRHAHGGHAKRIRCEVQWNDEVEAVFLDALGASCNVRLACEEAGVGTTSAYRQRRLRADFAAKWQCALEEGYVRLDMALIEAANAALGAVPAGAGAPLPPMTVDQAIRLLQLHRASATGQGRRSGWVAPVRSTEHHRASILRKIAAIRAAAGGPGANGGGAIGGGDG